MQVPCRHCVARREGIADADLSYLDAQVLDSWYVVLNLSSARFKRMLCNKPMLPHVQLVWLESGGAVLLSISAESS